MLFGMSVAAPSRHTATALLVVPRSMPTIKGLAPFFRHMPQPPRHGKGRARARSSGGSSGGGGDDQRAAPVFLGPGGQAGDGAGDFIAALDGRLDRVAVILVLGA